MDLGYVYTYPYAMAADFSKRETTRWCVLPGESTWSHLQSCHRDQTWVWSSLCIQVPISGIIEDTKINGASPKVENQKNPDCVKLYMSQTVWLYMSHDLNSSTEKLPANAKDRRGVYRLKGI